LSVTSLSLLYYFWLPAAIVYHNKHGTSLLSCLQGQQAAVKLSATYDGILMLSQFLCYCFDSKLRKWSSHRIIVRHMAVAALLMLLVLVSQFRAGAAA
jgi:hypothetical protein